MKKTSILAFNGIIATIYVVLTIAPALIPSVGSLLYGSVQFRISEALCVMPFFVKKSPWGLFIGCAVTNYLGMSLGLTMPIDIVVGSLATLIAALITSKIKIRWLVPVPTILVNAIIVGIMLTTLFPMGDISMLNTFLTYAISVGFGQTVVCYLLGMPLLFLLEKRVFSLTQFKKYLD